MDEVQKVERPPTLTEAVVRHLQSAIVDGRFPPGTQLPESRLARQLENSRGTVREALHVLREQGLVDIYPHRGAFVAQMTPQAVAEVMELRSLLESYAIKVALDKGPLSATSRSTVEKAYESLREASTSADSFAMIDADVAFHTAVAACASNETLQALLGRLQLQTRRFILLTKIYSSDGVGELEAHRPILEAVTAGDSARAEAAVRDHIVRTGTELLDQMAAEAVRLRSGARAHAVRRPAAPAEAQA